MMAYVLACMLFLLGSHAGAGATESRVLPLARAIVDVVAERGPLFKGEDGERRTLALMVAVAYRESTFKADAIGDHGRSVCAFQILHGARSLLTDVRACTDAGYTQLAASVRACPGHPVAPYARGTCESEDGRRISADRMRVARSLLGVVARPATQPTGATP